MRYSIEGQELTDIADALRSQLGDTKTITVTEEVKVTPFKISKTPNTTGHGDYGLVTKDINDFDVVKIEGASSIKVTLSTKMIGIDTLEMADGEYEKGTFPHSTAIEFVVNADVSNKVYNFSTNAVTFYRYFLSNNSAEKGYYAKVVGFDENGEEIVGEEIIEQEVEKEIPRVYQSSEMAQGIRDIASVPPEALVITGDCYHRFYKGGWDWFIEKHGDKVTTKDIADAEGMFAQTKVTEIPFVINMKQNVAKLGNLLSNVSNIIKLPTIKLDLVNPTYDCNFTYLIYNCTKVRDAENMFNPDELELLSTIKVTATYTCPKYSNIFEGCYSLRKLPSWFYKLRFSEESTVYPSNSSTLFYNGFGSCYALDELINLPVVAAIGAQTSQMFNRTFYKCSRVKNMTFETNEDGTPKVVKWKAQTIELNNDFGWVSSSSYITYHNSGITADKEVTDDATYQALKDDPDWFTRKVEYSRYNHDSAVATINSLPDTSAYASGNIIKFKGTAGSKTDGGAINTLTEEEIAVAAAKGWTVTLA